MLRAEKAGVPFRFVLLRGPTKAHPGAPVGLVYRAYAHGENVWVMSLNPAGATRGRVARLLALLTVDQALQVLPPTLHPLGPGVGLLAEDGSLRDHRGQKLPPEVHAEVNRIAAELDEKELYYMERLRRFFSEEGLPVGLEPVPESHPSYDPALEQVFAPEPPLLAVRSGGR